MTDDLRAQVARIRPGDKVTASFQLWGEVFTVTGPAVVPPTSPSRLHLGLHTLRWLSDGSVGDALISIDAHEPFLPPEPPVGSVVVKDGRARIRWWNKNPNGTNWAGEPGDGRYYSWAELASGNVIFNPGGKEVGGV